MEEDIGRLLDDYAQSGELPPNSIIKEVKADLTELYPPFVSQVVSLAEGEYRLEAEFLRYLYHQAEGFYVEGKNANDYYAWYPGRFLGGAVPGTPVGPLTERTPDVMIITPQEVPLITRVNQFKAVKSMTPISEGVRGFLLSTLHGIGFQPRETCWWYTTSLIKFCNPNSDGSIPAAWINGCFPWVLQEIAILQPKYIVCADVRVLKKFLGPSATQKAYMGRLVDITLPLKDGRTYSCKLICIPSLGTSVDPDVEPLWIRQFKLIYNDLRGIQKDEAYPIRHVVIRDAKSLEYHINRIKQLSLKDPHRRIIAVDLEWEGEYPQQEGAHVLTVQFSSYPGEATVVELTNSKGDVVFKEGLEVASRLLESLFTPNGDWKPRLGGHFLRADLPWLLSLGISEVGIKHAYQPAETPEQCKDDGGWDTGLMYHAYRDAEEIGDGYGLKALALKECGIDRYDVKLLEEYKDYVHCTSDKKRLNETIDRINNLYNRLKSRYNRSRKLKQKYQWAVDIVESRLKAAKQELKDLPTKRVPKGFGCISRKTLLPYAAWDADATRRLAELCIYGLDGRKALLDDDGYAVPEVKKGTEVIEEAIPGNSCWEPFWRAHRASWGFGEMERTGFVLDVERLNKLSHLFNSAYHTMLEKFRTDINWSEFNPNSSEQRRGLLFGRSQSKKKDGTYSMPDEAISFDLTPIRATDKTAWESIDEEDIDGYSASTDSLSMSIFAQKYPEVRMFKDICKLGRTLAGNIRPPIDTLNLDGTVTTTWDKGIYTYMRPADHTVHTHLSQTKKTGRASSSDPPMQNIGKSAEALLQTTLGYKDSDGEVIANYPELFPEPMYLYPCRTILRARPGNVLIESDFTGAELAVMAWASGDPNMIEHVRRNALSEDDPDFYDIHSHIAVKAFQLNCEPTKKGLASIHCKHLRVAAKAVVFG